jgi:CRISPR-associated protein Cmr6
MSTPNIGWLYYKDYHKSNGDQVQFFRNAPSQKGDRRDEYFQQHYEEKNATILGASLDIGTSTCLQVVPTNAKLCFKTIYPGLTLGTGYTHETGELGEFKLGFFFDYATGYPCIPGSTVKGCLRGMFPQKERDGVADKEEKYNCLASVIRELANVNEEIINEHELGEEFDQKEHPKRIAFIDRLEVEIFDGKKLIQEKDGSNEFQPICIYERDIFFDGYIVSTNHPAINRSAYQNQKPFIGDDYITPHINRKKPELSPFTNPVPLMFLKILPEVTIQFQFDLKSREDGLLTKEQKEGLFRRLLLDFGIGAKTNVGYGQFEEGKKSPVKLPPPAPEFVDQIPSNAFSSLRQRSSFLGEMIEQIGVYNIYQFTVGREVCKVKKRTEKNPALKVGDKVTILIKLDYKRGESLAFQVK